ncbi:MAG: tetratricopeptide repeat protein [Candidatus Obscuribacterales bacterium]|nr:tetratricopeptide repeat protein [Candidatus Obscuribacterales bacterium]
MAKKNSIAVTISRDCSLDSTKIALALTIALSTPMVWTPGSAHAADFSHAKKIVVPPSSIPRRYDYSNNTGREAGLPSGYSSGYATNEQTSYPSSYDNSAGRAGLMPPPPPVTPSLLPASMAGDIPAAALSQGAGIPRSAAAGSSNYQQTNADPARVTSLARHAENSHANKLGAENAIVGHVSAQADTLVKEGKLQEAQDLLERYEKTYPHNTTLTSKLSQISLDRAKYYIRTEDYVEGAKQARLALSYNSGNTEAKHALEQVLRHHGIEPHHSLSRVKLGDLLFSQGKLKEARVEYESALKVDHSTQAYIGLGNIALREHKLKDAKSHYQLALEKDSESSVALRQLGIVRYKLKDVVGANADLSRALVLNQEDKLAGQTLIELWQRQVSMRPKDANSHLGLARAYQLSGDLKSAQASYRNVVSVEPNHPNLPAARQSFKLALARQEAQKMFEAAKTLDSNGALSEAYAKSAESVSLSPGDVKFRTYQAELAERLGNLPDAKYLYLEVLRQDPKNLIAAQKVKLLSDKLATVDTGQALRGPIGQIGLRAQAEPLQMTNNQGASATAGALGAAAGTALGSMSSLFGTPQTRNTEGPALASLPEHPDAKTPTADPVANMTGFLGDLRNYMLVQKKELQKQEDTVLENIGARKKDSSSAGLGSALGDLPDLPKMANMPNKMITSKDIQKLLATTGSGTSSKKKSFKGATSPNDISKLLSEGGENVTGSLPTSSSETESSLPKGLSASALEGVLGDSAALARTSTNSSDALGDSILSAPTRGSESILKVAEVEPPLAPPIGQSSFNSAPSFSAAAETPVGAPPVAPAQLSVLLAQAQSLSPQALTGIARSLGMDPGQVAALASQAPQILSNAPQLINQGLARVKQEDLDKAYKAFKDHVAKQQAAAKKPDSVSKKPIEIAKKSTTATIASGKASAAKAAAKPTPINTAKKEAQKPLTTKPATARTAIASDKAAALNTGLAAAGQIPSQGIKSGFAGQLPTSVDAASQAAATATSALGDTNSPSSMTALATVPAAETQRLDSLEAQNRALMSQLENTRKELQELRESVLSRPSKGQSKKMKASKSRSNKSPSNRTDTTNSAALEPQASSETPSIVPAAESQDTLGLRGLNNGAAQSAPRIASLTPQATALGSESAKAGYSSPSGLPAAAQAAFNSAEVTPVSPIVNLELTGINVKPKGVRLNVVLRNGTSQELSLPSTTKAIVRMIGQPDQVAEVKFPVRAIMTGQEARGYISVQGHKLDPAADVFIPKLMSTDTGPKDIHLTVPISALSSIPH